MSPAWEALGRNMRQAAMSAWLRALTYAQMGSTRASARDLRTSLDVLETLAAMGAGSIEGAWFCVDASVSEFTTVVRPSADRRATVSSPSCDRRATVVRPSMRELNDSANLANTERERDQKEQREVESGSKSSSSAAADLFEFWRQTMGKSDSAKLTADRKSKINARLRDGRSVEELKQAITGCAMSPFHMGDNDRQTAYNDLVTIFKSDATVQQHIDRALGARTTTAILPKPIRQLEWYEAPEYVEAERWFDDHYPPHSRPTLRLRVLRYIALEEFNKAKAGNDNGTDDTRAIVPIERIDLAERAREVEPIVKRLG